MSLDEEVLELVAKDGQMVYEKWPALLEPLLERLDYIVHHEFRIPQMTTFSSFETVQTLPLTSHPASQSIPNNSNKENAPPSQVQSPQRPPVPSFSSITSDPTDHISESQNSQRQSITLPPLLADELSSIKNTLRSYFSQKPPHTIQRLAELILHPTQNYKTLPAYIRAVDRVVSVSSGADIFPLPVSIPSDSILDKTLKNGVNGVGNAGFLFNDSSLGSDESLGGALLTPIPWLTNSPAPSDDDDMITETGDQTVNDDMMGLRSNAHQSGVHTDHDNHTNEEAHGHATVGNMDNDAPHDSDNAEEVPHARGPDLLGVEDLGLQDGKGVTMSLARSSPQPGTVGNTRQSVKEAATDKTVDEDAPGEPDEDHEVDADGDIDIMDTDQKDASGEASNSSRKDPDIGISGHTQEATEQETEIHQ